MQKKKSSSESSFPPHTPWGLRAITPFNQKKGKRTIQFRDVYSNRTCPKKKPIRRKPWSMTSSMKLHLNASLRHACWDTQKPHIHLYSVFSQTGEYWGIIRGGTHIRWAQVRGVFLSGTSRREAVGPDWSYLPAPDLGINFVLGDTGCYGRQSLVQLAAWKKHMEADILRSGRAHSGTWRAESYPSTTTEEELVRGRGTRIYSRGVSSLIHSDIVTENMKITSHQFRKMYFKTVNIGEKVNNNKNFFYFITQQK